MQYCPNCGAKIKINAKKCPTCGYQLVAEPQRTPADVNNKDQTYSRAQRYHQSSTNSVVSFLLWLKNNPIMDVLAIIFVILTYVYIGKWLSLVVALGLIVAGYWHANRRQTNLDQKIRNAFRRKQPAASTAMKRRPLVKPRVDHYQQPNFTKPIHPQTQAGVTEVSPIAPATKLKTQRSWLLLIIAGILLSSSYWPNFFSNNFFGSNVVTNFSLAQTIKQALNLLNYYFHFQINPDLGLWIIAAGPLLIILGALMPNHFGKKLIKWGNFWNLLWYFGGWLILHVSLSFAAKSGVMQPLSLGASGKSALTLSVFLLILTIWDWHQFKQSNMRQ